MDIRHVKVRKQRTTHRRRFSKLRPRFCVCTGPVRYTDHRALFIGHLEKAENRLKKKGLSGFYCGSIVDASLLQHFTFGKGTFGLAGEYRIENEEIVYLPSFNIFLTSSKSTT